MSDTLKVENREQTGSAASRRLRRTGMVPAVLYGHGEGNAHLAISARDIKTALRHHSKTVTLEGAVSDTALVADVHYDALGIEILHLDLIRVNLKEQVEVTVAVHLKGESVGVREGGILLENTHEVQIGCPAGEIPESIDVDISELALGGHIAAKELVLPENVALITAPDTVIVHVEKPKGMVEAADSVAAGEPEVIAKGSSEEGE